MTSSPVLRTVRIGNPSQFPSFLALDPQAGRVLAVTNSNSQTLGPGIVSVLDATNGAVVQVHAGAVRGRPTAVAVDPGTGHGFVVQVVYTMSGYTGTVSMLRTRTGDLLRSLPLRQGPPGAIIVDAASGRAFAIENAPPKRGGQIVSTIDTRTGAILRAVSSTVDQPDAVVDAPVGRVFISDQFGDTITVLNARTGARLRVMKLSMAASPPLVGTYSLRVLAVDNRTGRLFVVDSGLGPRATRLTIIDGHTLHVLHQVILRDRALVYTAAVDNRTGHLLLVSQHTSTIISLIDGRTGKLLHTARIGGVNFAIAIDEITERAFIAVRETNTVTIIDTLTGAVLHTVTVGKGPSQVVVDERTARAFVLNNDDTSISVLATNY